jgi:hypothetical protein
MTVSFQIAFISFCLFSAFAEANRGAFYKWCLDHEKSYCNQPTSNEFNHRYKICKLINGS